MFLPLIKKRNKTYVATKVNKAKKSRKTYYERPTFYTFLINLHISMLQQFFHNDVVLQ